MIISNLIANKNLVCALTFLAVALPASAQVRVTYSASNGAVVFSVTPNMSYPVDCDVTWSEVSINTGGVNGGSTSLIDIPGNGTSQSGGEFYRGGVISEPYATCRISRRELQRQQEAANRRQAAEQVQRAAEQKRRDQEMARQREEAQRQAEEQTRQQAESERRQNSTASSGTVKQSPTRTPAMNDGWAEARAAQQREQQLRAYNESQQRAKESAGNVSFNNQADQEAVRRAEENRRRTEDNIRAATLESQRSQNEMVNTIGRQLLSETATSNRLNESRIEQEKLQKLEDSRRVHESEKLSRLATPNPYEAKTELRDFSVAFKLWQSSEFVAAEYAFKDAIEKNPNVPSAKFYLASTLQKLGKTDEAKKVITAVLNGKFDGIEYFRAQALADELSKQRTISDVAKVINGKWKIAYLEWILNIDDRGIVIAKSDKCWVCKSGEMTGKLNGNDLKMSGENDRMDLTLREDNSLVGTWWGRTDLGISGTREVRGVKID